MYAMRWYIISVFVVFWCVSPLNETCGARPKLRVVCPRELQRDAKCNVELLFVSARGAFNNPRNTFNNNTLSLVQCRSPIMGTVQTVYSWSSYFVSWLGNTANITFCVLVIPGMPLVCKSDSPL